MMPIAYWSSITFTFHFTTTRGFQGALWDENTFDKRKNVTSQWPKSWRCVDLHCGGHSCRLKRPVARGTHESDLGVVLRSVAEHTWECTECKEDQPKHSNKAWPFFKFKPSFHSMRPKQPLMTYQSLMAGDCKYGSTFGMNPTWNHYNEHDDDMQSRNLNNSSALHVYN